MLIARYDFILAGQLSPIIGRETFWQYFPSSVEILTVVGALSLCILFYSLADRYLPIESVHTTIHESVEEEETGEYKLAQD